MRFGGNLLLISLIFILTNEGISCYLPVICLPGVLDTTLSLLRICTQIEFAHKGTKGYFIQSGGPPASIVGMWKQIELYRPLINKVFEKHPDGVHIIGHSQGTAIARAIVQTTPNHPVKNFLSVAGMWKGIFGIPFTNGDILGIVNVNNMTRNDIYKLAYTESVQDGFSVAGYWNDPHHQDLYLANCKFLPLVNNEIEHEKMTEYKNNFLRLKKLILFGGGKEEVIIPKNSSFMGFYDDKLNIVPMKDQLIYKNDSFGARTLDERGDLIQVYAPEANHIDWVINPFYTTEYFLKYLD